MIYLVKCYRKKNVLNAGFIVATEDSSEKIDKILAKDKKFRRVKNMDEVEKFFSRHYVPKGYEIPSRLIGDGGKKSADTVSILFDYRRIYKNSRTVIDHRLLTAIFFCYDNDKNLKDSTFMYLPKDKGISFNAEDMLRLMDDYLGCPCEEYIVDYEWEENGKPVQVHHHYICAYLKDYFECMNLAEDFGHQLWQTLDCDHFDIPDFIEEDEEEYLEFFAFGSGM